MRCLLFAGALGTLGYIMKKIRKNRLKIDHSIFWILFSSVLVLVSIFPGILTWAASTLGFISPANMVFLLVIFLLILNLFAVTIKLSLLENKLRLLVQHIALMEASSNPKENDAERSACEDPFASK